MNDHLDLVMKHAVDSAVSAAMERFRPALGEDTEVAHRAAHLAAEIAVEQFRSYCKVEMSLIEADRELRLRHARLFPPSMILNMQDKPDG